MTVKQNITHLIPLELVIANPWQTRTALDPEHIAALAADIETNGLLQAPVGRLVENGTPVSLGAGAYGGVVTWIRENSGRAIQLAFGHNRLGAFWQLRKQDAQAWGSIPILVQDLSDQQMADFAWAENERRRDHTPLERALAIRKRIQDFNWTQDETARHMGISRSAVANALRLLKLPEAVLQPLGDGRLSERQAMALAALYDLPASLLERAEREFDYNGSDSRKPSRILEHALAGASSNWIRSTVNRIVLSCGRSLKDADFDRNDRKTFEPYASELTSVTCTGCLAEVVSEAGAAICTENNCFNRKQEIFRQTRLAKASAETGIPILDPDKTYPHAFWSGDGVHLPALRKAGCENLRLQYSVRAGQGPCYLAEEGHPHIVIVCQKRQGYCTCLQGAEAKAAAEARAKVQQQAEARATGENGSKPAEPRPVEATPAAEPTAAELQDAARQARKAEAEARKGMAAARELATGEMAKALGAGRLDALRSLVMTFHGASRETASGWGYEKIWQVLAERVIGEPWNGEKAARYFNRLSERLKEAGVGELDPEGNFTPYDEPAAEVPDLRPDCICGHPESEHTQRSGCQHCSCEVYEPAIAEVPFPRL
jgi:ParB/RepB/Spo0J family partition protein